MTELLHITERAAWQAAVQTGEYRLSTRGVTLAEQGFIHCSLPHQLRPVAEFIYGEVDEELVVLVIDDARLDVPVRYEPAGPGLPEFPHIYGPLPTSAVVEVVPVTRDAEGRLGLPDAPAGR